MTFHPPPGKPSVPLALLGTGEPVEILYEAELPVVFTINSEVGVLLAYVTAETPSGNWLVLAPTGRRSIERLRRGEEPLRQALTDSWMWLALHDGAWKEAWAIEEADLPAGYLPVPRTPLLPDHEPVLSTKALGATIVPGVVPASVVAFVASATRGAVKTLVDFVYDESAGGRPKEEIRRLYDLPVRRLAFGSFEIDFGKPQELMFDDDFKRVVGLLQKGLHWAVDNKDVPLVAGTDRERQAILYALRGLTPPKGSAVEVVQISGPWLESRSVRLTQATRRRVAREIKKLHKEKLVIIGGRIGEFDDDRESFTLRDTEIGKDVRAFFRKEQLEELRKLYVDRVHPVWLVGIHRDDRLHVAAVLTERPTEVESIDEFDDEADDEEASDPEAS